MPHLQTQLTKGYYCKANTGTRDDVNGQCDDCKAIDENKYYCGKWMGVIEKSAHDGYCGLNYGPQCDHCKASKKQLKAEWWDNLNCWIYMKERQDIPMSDFSNM